MRKRRFSQVEAKEAPDLTTVLLDGTTLQPDTLSIVRAYVGRLMWRAVTVTNTDISVSHLEGDQWRLQCTTPTFYTSFPHLVPTTMTLIQSRNGHSNLATCMHTQTSFKISNDIGFGTIWSAFSADGSLAAAMQHDGSIALWYTRTNATRTIPPPSNGRYQSVHLGPDVNVLYASVRDHGRSYVSRMNLRSAASDPWTPLLVIDCVSIQLSRDGRWFYGLYHSTNQFAFTSVDNPTDTRRPKQLKFSHDYYNCATATSVSGQFFATVHWINPQWRRLCVFTWGSFDLLWEKTFSSRRTTLDRLVFSEDDTELLVAFSTGVCETLHLDMRTGRFRTTTKPPHGRLLALEQVCV